MRFLMINLISNILLETKLITSIKMDNQTFIHKLKEKKSSHTDTELSHMNVFNTVYR